MTGLKRATVKSLMVFSGRANPQLAEEVAYQLGTNLVPTSAYEFANSEMYVRYEESVRGCDAFVIQSHAAPVNEWIMEHLIMVDALKRASAKRITVVMPYYGYSRQDKKHRGREPISARLIADLFKTAGADRLSTARSSWRLSHRTPAGSRSPSSGPSVWVVRLWRSSTRPATSTGPTRSWPTALSVRSGAVPASWSTT
jgi:hypothetical protein